MNSVVQYRTQPSRCFQAGINPQKFTFKFSEPRQQCYFRKNDVRMRGLFGLGLPEIAVVAGLAALVFGPSKLPELGKELGKTVKSFQTAAKEFETELKNAADETSDKIEEQANQVKDNVKK